MSIGKIEVFHPARRSILTYATLSEDGSETGGILLGRGPDSDGVISVECAGDPGPKAIREPGFFLRDLDHARQIAADAWDSSKAVWVGEWHTHLNGSTFPSTKDLATYMKLLAASELAFSHFVSIIVTPDAVQAWRQPLLSPWLLMLGDPTEIDA